jgi:mono/diheme cytochrome c family protein
MKTIILILSMSLWAITWWGLSGFQTSSLQGDPLKESAKRGKSLYETHCQSCHLATGLGVNGAFPPLAKSDYLMADTKRSIRQLIEGLKGKITVNGKDYNGMMASFAKLDDQKIADVLNYIRNSWGNKGKIIMPQDVKIIRQERN